MGVFNGMFPIQAGKEEDARVFAAETVGARLAGYEAHHARVGNTRETFTLQETPMGSFRVERHVEWWRSGFRREQAAG
jgi:hypothetical protein